MSIAVPTAAAELMADDSDAHRRQHHPTAPPLPDGAPHTAETPEADRAAELAAKQPNRYEASRLDIVELIRRGPPEEDWLLEPIFARGRVHALVAKGGAGKSLLSFYIAASLAIGIDPFTGRQIEPLRVLYIDHEMNQDDVFERLESFGYVDPDYWAPLGENLYYSQLPDVDPLDSQPGADELIALADSVDPDLLIVDTLSRVIQGAENEADTFISLYRMAWQPLKARGVTVVRLDHTGHEGTRARGSSAKDQDADVVWSLTTTDEDAGWVLKNLKKRMGWVPGEVPLAKVQGEALTVRQVSRQWPEGTAEVAKNLDVIEWPIDKRRGTGYRLADQALKAAGYETKRNGVTGAALAYRRTEEYQRSKGGAVS